MINFAEIWFSSSSAHTVGEGNTEITWSIMTVTLIAQMFWENTSTNKNRDKFLHEG